MVHSELTYPCSPTLGKILTSALGALLLIVSVGLAACSGSPSPQDSAEPDESETSHDLSLPTEINAGDYPSYLYASVCQAKNGDILVFTRVGNTHAQDKGKIVLFRSSDGGVTWGDAEIVAEDSTYDCRNPICVCLPSGRIILGHAVYGYEEALTTQPNRILYSDDNGNSWANLATVDYPPYFASAGGIIIVPRSGDLLLPCEDTTVVPWRAVILVSTDGGITWSERASFSKSEHYFNEPTLAYADNGNLCCIIRDDNFWYYWYAESEDDGETWSEPVPYPQMTGSQPSLARIGDHLVLLSRDELTPETPGITSPGLALYSSRYGTIWWGKKYLWTFSPMGDNFHASYGSVLPVSSESSLVFFSVEKVDWADSGIYCLPLVLEDVNFQGKSLPVRILDIETLNAGATSDLDRCRALTLEDADILTLTVECAYDALATAGIKVHIYSSYDGVVYDTEELVDNQGVPLFGNMPFSPGEVTRQTRDVICNTRFIKVVIENEGQNQPVIDLRVTAVANR